MSVPSLPGQIISEPAKPTHSRASAHFNTNSNANTNMADKFESNNEGNPNQMVIGGKWTFSDLHPRVLSQSTMDQVIIGFVFSFHCTPRVSSLTPSLFFFSYFLSISPFTAFFLLITKLLLLLLLLSSSSSSYPSSAPYSYSPCKTLDRKQFRCPTCLIGGIDKGVSVVLFRHQDFNSGCVATFDHYSDTWF
jgi:hypothetical protein